MSTQQNTTSQASQTGQFNPASMAAFNTLIPQWQQAVSGYMNNPFGNPFFNTQRQMGTNQAQQQGGTQMSSLLGNLNAQGFGGNANAPWASEMIANQGRANMANTANLGFLAPMQNALQMQQFGMGQAGGFRPFQTGGTETGNQTQTTSGLGSWLPQVIGAGLGFASGAGGGGGLLGGFKGLAGAGGGGSPYLGMAGGGGQMLPTSGTPWNYSGNGAGTMFGSMPNPYLMGGGQ